MTKTRFGLCALVLALAAAAMLSSADAQKTKGKTRPAQTKYLMRGILRPNCAGLGGLLKEGIKTDEQWDTAACQASCMNEMSHLLMADGRCPDKVWADAAKALRAGTEEALAAIDKKDAEATQAAFKAATASCGACHKAHKK